MLHNSIRKISSDFIKEAVSSPKLLADMASMEKYMAESYNGRVFVELLQNADDCFSKNICIKEIDGDIVFANDGNPFNEEDVLAICRSGASNKERGKSIGYRGVGFKSTTYLTDEIIIYSDKTYFTFSKKHCADQVGVSVDDVPMIRIPLLISNPSEKHLKCVSELLSAGYNTVFIFKDAKINDFSDELQMVDSGYFIFLNNVENCYIEMHSIKKEICLERKSKPEGMLISFLNEEKNAWYVIKNTHAALGIKYDKNNELIIPCLDTEQVFHSYLPTYDKVLYPVKINADFSTDPSRKHITLDEKTENALVNVAQLFVEVINKALNGDLSIDFKNILTIMNSTGAFSRCNSFLKKEIKNSVIKDCKIKLRSGKQIPLTEYKVFPEWLEEAEKAYLRECASYIAKDSAETDIYGTYDNVDGFVKQFSDNEFSMKDIIEVMKEKSVVEKMSPETQGKFISKIIKKEKLSKDVKDEIEDLSAINILTEVGVKNLGELSDTNIKINERIRETLCNNVNSTMLDWFEAENNMRKGLLKNNEKEENKKVDSLPNVKEETIKPHITKWRSAEQQCIEIEKFFGNTAVDVSKRNLGYDIESITPNGKRRLIEVKAVSSTGEFSITNNEYTAAHQYGVEYYICLISQEDKKLKVIYINNPLEKLVFEKRIRQWEWVCEGYTGDSYSFEL